LKAKTVLVLFIAFIVTFLSVGFPYWQIPYSKVSLPDSLYSYGVAIAFVVAIISRYYYRASFLQVFSVVGLAVPAVVMARVEFDTLKDPTSHNLWPIEIVIAAAIGLTISFIGALLASLLLFIVQKGSQKHSGT
jgi:hypothetical protein